MSPDLWETVNLVRFTEEILNEKLHYLQNVTYSEMTKQVVHVSCSLLCFQYQVKSHLFTAFQ